LLNEHQRRLLAGRFVQPRECIWGKREQRHH
jgi:hypothetical protein